MTGPRTTRAASSRASSVAPSNVTATPRRSIRTNPAPSPLPLVNPRESTAYGTGIAALPTAIRRRAHAQDLTETFAGILGPVHQQYQAQVEADQAAQLQAAAASANNRGGRGRGRTPRGTASIASTPAINQSASYGPESNLFPDVDDPVIPQESNVEDQEESDREEVEEEYESHEDESLGEESDDQDDQIDGQDPVNHLGGYLVTQATQNETVSFSQRFYMAVKIRFVRLMTSLAVLSQLLIDSSNHFAQWLWRQPMLTFCIFLLTTLSGVLIFLDFSQFNLGGDILHHLADVRHTIGQYTPAVIYPLASLNDAAIRTLGVKMDHQQDEISHIDLRTTLTEDAINQIQSILNQPAYLLGKDKDGNPELPTEFWTALKRKLMHDLPYLSEETYKQYVRENADQDRWDVWTLRNRFRVRHYLNQELNEELALMAKNTEISMFREDEIVKLIERKWAEIGGDLGPQIEKLTKGVSTALRDSRRAKDLVVDMSNDLSSGNFFGHVQGIAMADYYIGQKANNANKALQRVNHLSPVQGARINPQITSTTFDPLKRVGFFQRLLVGSPSPNPPIAAITKWDEAGECWCAENKVGGLVLAVLLPREVVPDEIVIEHVPSTATLDPDSMPRRMELYVHVYDQQKRWKMEDESQRLFSEGDRYLNEYWVRIAAWVYENKGPQTQIFPITFDVDPFLSVNHIAIRALDNWGDTDHTCLYRVRLHGQLASSFSTNKDVL